ncbi:C-type lectin domain family 4 member A-like [Sorex araneus]|uniref:C-type lectin domain family 4 member A-like n=1 Tax=Sorex araneus TaxID=42254 RepID=UPI002433A1B0|nr:C-type lectin domain family 4 member A-like [Sorex araneus]
MHRAILISSALRFQEISLTFTFRNLKFTLSFFQIRFKRVPEETLSQKVTHTLLECKKENLTIEGKSWSCCPKNWKPFGSNCYFVSSDEKTWSDSEKHCAGMQAHLLVVDSKEEQDFINENVNKSYDYYLGLSDVQNGRWEWVNETPYNHSATFWLSGEPSNDFEHCVELHFRKQWGWNDVSCYETQHSICEMLKIYL